MLNISNIFGKSPFAPLQTHMERVALCIAELPHLYEALEKGDEKKLSEIAGLISKLEHAADLTKNDMRNHLPKGLFLPINRGCLLELISLQDALADSAEEIAVILNYRTLDLTPLRSTFEPFWKKNLEIFHLAHQVIQEFDRLLESSFGGIEAEKVKAMVEQIAFREHEMNLLRKQLLRMLYHADHFGVALFHLWLSLIEEVALIGRTSEKLGNSIRKLLELK